MKYPFFASFIVLCLLLMYEIHKRRNFEEQKYQEFLDEETRANNTRKQNIDNLDYITIPFDSLPTDVHTDNDIISEYLESINSLKNTRILNLTGISNTELKLKYGAANLDTLSACDQSFTFLVRTLNDWAYALYEQECINEARTVLEYAMSIRSDVGSSFELLAKIYKETNQKDKIKELISIANEINSLMSKSIVTKLESVMNS